jgi:hypothetical protein
MHIDAASHDLKPRGAGIGHSMLLSGSQPKRGSGAQPQERHMNEPFDSAEKSSGLPAMRGAGCASVRLLARLPALLAPVLAGVVLAVASGQALAQIQSQDNHGARNPIRRNAVPDIQPLDNPIVRNPMHRNAIPDTAPVPPDPRNSDTRPTLPAAPPEPDGPRVMIPEPDPSRNAAPGRFR